MDVEHDSVRWVAEDRLSSLPDELIHKILSCFDMKFAVQTCLLSSRWKLLWTSMPCLNFSSNQFLTMRKFAKFVTHVRSHRNHQIAVSSVKLLFRGSVSQVFVKKIANYAFSHNVQQLNVSNPLSGHHEFPPCLFSSQSLKSFTFSCDPSTSPKTPLDFPALTTLNLRRITFGSDFFSKCINLKNLTLEEFCIKDTEVFDIITPHLSNLMLINSICIKVVNVIAPELENLTVIDCSIEYLNAPLGLSSLCYTFHPWNTGLPRFSNDQFHSLNKVTICLSTHYPNKSYKDEDACKTINMLYKFRSARYVTLNADLVEGLSSFPDVLSHYPSPFSNLICLTIASNKRKLDAYKVTMSSEARNFLLGNSPSAKFIMG